ncbi:hypothetical protein MASR1M12_15720 [Erysipelotrichia bacterium]
MILTTCYSIVSRHGGGFDVVSEPGRGSTFTFFLPAISDAEIVNQENKSEDHHGTGTFIIMDDEKMVRDVAGMIFDLTVPGGMGCVEAKTAIGKISTETPIFVSSGYSEDPAMSEPEKHGFTASISKPFRRSYLAKRLNRYMKPGNCS